MKELMSFFKLYIAEDGFFSSSMGVLLLILYASAGVYLLDFYNLMKKKSKMETVAILLIPVMFSLCGAVLAGIFVHVPNVGELGEFSLALQSPSLNIALISVVAAYLLVWSLSLLIQKKRRKKDVVRWLISCIPDYCFAAMLLICFGWHLITGKSIFLICPEWVLWLYLYAVYLLCCKIILLTVGVAVCLYSMRISVFKWNERKNPSAFLFRYFVIYQNAIIRNTVLFELGILIPLTLAVNREGWTFEMAAMMGFLYLGAVFVILFSLMPVMKTLSRFSSWGEPRRIKKLFCREYFVEEPLYKDANYTVTRHFLVDEQCPAAVYYWLSLKSIGGWSVDTNGKSRTLYFSDGECCQIAYEDADGLSPLFEHAKKYQDAEGYTSAAGSGISGTMENRYQSFIRSFAIVVAIIMMLVAYGIR